MIFEGSWDPEDWSNDAENSVLNKAQEYIKFLKYIQTENSYFKLQHYFTVLQFLLCTPHLCTVVYLLFKRQDFKLFTNYVFTVSLIVQLLIRVNTFAGVYFQISMRYCLS